MTSSLECRAAEADQEKNSLQLDLDPKPFTQHRQCIHRNGGKLSDDSLILDVRVTVLDVEALERQEVKQLPHKPQC